MNTPLSPRRRRLRLTAWTLGLLAVTALVIGLIRHFADRPPQYRPDEASADITSGLSRALPAGAPQPNFTNVTAAAGLAAFRNFAGTRTSQMPEDIGPGLAWGDYDNDGDDDLFLVSAGGALNLSLEQLEPCALFENLGDGTFRRVTAFPELRLRGYGAGWGDYDGDGRLDLVVSGFNALWLLHNDGEGRFTRDPRIGNRPGFFTGLAWGDYDGDRRLDLYVCNYLDYTASEADRENTSQQVGSAVPFTLNPASFTPGRNLLLHQQPDGSFHDVAAELKVQNPEGRSLGAIWHDFDLDGHLDLYVANDVSDNVFFRNLGGGRFEDISHPALIADYRSAMGLALGDYDRDGDDDLHVTHWVAQENALYDNTWMQFNGGTNVVAARGNNATGRFPLRFFDVADQRGLGQIALPFVGWGTEFADLDHDGWPDLLVANGNTLEEDGPYPKRLKAQELFVFWNERGQMFHNLAPLNPALSEQHSSRGLACSDFDGDGDLDFAVGDLGEGVRLFRNDLAHGHWLKVRLRSKNAAGQAAGFGEGSVATVWLGETPLRRASASPGYLSPASHTLHWGLDTATNITRLAVRWHGGATQEFTGLATDTFYELAEGDPVPRVLVKPSAGSPGARTFQSVAPLDERQRQLAFWKAQRAGMDAMKVRGDNAAAIPLFRDAISLNPQHEDSRYYLGLCLASQGDTAAALAALAELQQLSPQSHRAWQQWGVIQAIAAKSDADLAAAEQALLKAQAINPEETGALLVLGEVALLRGDMRLAEERLQDVTRTNHRSVGGHFLLGYLAWKRGDQAAARVLLEEARKALGPDWQPKGATSEGDVRKKQHLEPSPLAPCWESWDGQAEPGSSFALLEGRLRPAKGD